MPRKVTRAEYRRGVLTPVQAAQAVRTQPRTSTLQLERAEAKATGPDGERTRLVQSAKRGNAKAQATLRQLYGCHVWTREELARFNATIRRRA